MDWKKELKELKHAYIKATRPQFYEASGGKDYKISPYTDKTANGLTKCIIDYITFRGGYANRINTQGQARKERINLAFGNYRDKITFTPSTTNKGSADIRALVFGRSLDIEVKIGKDKMSLNQLKEMVRIQEAGGLYFVARDMQSFVDFYKETFADILMENLLKAG